MTKKQIWRISKTVLKVCITAVALYWVFSKVEADYREQAIENSKAGSDKYPLSFWQFIGQTISGSNPIFLALAFVAYGCSIVIASSRLNGFFKGVGLALSERYNFRLYLLGLFYNLFLPGGVGGDGYKIYFLRRKFEVKGRKLLSAVFFDRLSGLWALCLITAALVIFIPHLQIPSQVPIVVVIIGSIVYYSIIHRYFSDYSKRFFRTHLKALGVQSMQVICAIFLLYALGFEGKFAPYLLMFLVSSLVAVVPFTVGGLGAREMVFVFGAAYFNLDKNLALLISLLFYLTSALLAATGAYFIFRPQGLGEDKLPEATAADLERLDNDENN
ncbi:lysylphosphatidylglycerol synthase transmembrane domain-containing protein [Parapedobacter sp. 10938]|uniref:lysylphosphatidylglycerol synthase transmembrane domain-containing protein n=1 Tax=Parapedobacter flavus TaxID=3110225 RepID=UPI002DC01936|nr:lysylphosphatidylglycerol synthase transmembrane domain-containing protein [Parapedobacter sp. 10938]MEC3879417.1 lysylphosphatidylglycerol synthase transmembrane domain-containing protein [Parapedobacter sp. 10938]